MSKFNSFNDHIRRAVLVGTAVFALTAGVMPAAAQPKSAEEVQTETTGAVETGNIVFATNYPNVSVKAGSSATFSLYLTNGTEQDSDIALSAEGMPEGWEGFFRGSDSEVSGVHLYAYQAKSDSPALTYTVNVPDKAEEGTYPITLKAVGDGVDTEVNIQVTVTSVDRGESDFTTKYAEQQGASGTSFSFDTTLANNSADAQSYSLSSDAPEGWNVSFTPSSGSSAVTSLSIDAGTSSAITVAVKPADTVTKGDYTINLTAQSAEETLTLPLTISITGTYGVTFSTPTGNLSASAYAGEEKQVTMTVTNTGNIDLTDLNLSGAGSTDWEISFAPQTIDTLAAGETKEITATIKPAENAIIGDYVTAMTVSNATVKSNCALRISVKNHTTWGVTAIAVIAVLVLGLAMIIRKYGRR